MFWVYKMQLIKRSEIKGLVYVVSIWNKGTPRLLCVCYIMYSPWLDNNQIPYQGIVIKLLFIMVNQDLLHYSNLTLHDPLLSPLCPLKVFFLSWSGAASCERCLCLVDLLKTSHHTWKKHSVFVCRKTNMARSTNVAAMQQLRSSAQKMRSLQITYQIIPTHRSCYIQIKYYCGFFPNVL
jgi:hypothetical protein